MLQRIQTIYLLIITILGTLACWLQIEFILAFVREIADVSFVILLFFAFALALIPIFSFVTIFLFKKRKLQIKFIWIAVIFIVIYYLTACYIIMKLQIDLRGVLAGGAIFLNLINLILCNLAISAIKKDEDLVKAADRLR